MFYQSNFLNKKIAKCREIGYNKERDTRKS